MADNFQEKTEQPTSRRLEEARKKGEVAKSMEVNSAMSLLFGLLLLYMFSSQLFRQLTQILHRVLSGGYMVQLTPESIYQFMLQGLSTIGMLIGFFMLGMLLVGLASSISQVGFLFTLEPIKPKPDKLDPLKGIKKIIFSKKSLEELIKNLVKLIFIVIVAYKAVTGYKDDFIPLVDQGPLQLLTFMLKAALVVSFKIAAIFLVVAAADYAFQKWEHLNNLKMTKQEIKDEMKQTEGDPKIKSKIRSLQMQMSRNRMMAAVPEADVVITNPTHFAVALRYQGDKENSPRVVAKGRNRIAQKIKEIAGENGVTIVEDPPLARALFKAVEIDEEIPAKFFQAVAEVLAYVYRLKNKRMN
ncbi:MAG: flagellar biosynthesis protein FlhB [Calditrichia bacterium]